ncbi:MAG: hypothetical protein JEY97_00350 [Bacteroidales bacterium]|nr:hypothetical protein [Bacteroidales bacterium]
MKNQDPIKRKIIYLKKKFKDQNRAISNLVEEINKKQENNYKKNRKQK